MGSSTKWININSSLAHNPGAGHVMGNFLQTKELA